MTRSRLSWFWGFLLTLLPVCAVAQSARVDETGLRIGVTATDARLKIPVTTSLREPASARLKIEFLDAAHHSVLTLDRDVILPAGAATLDAPLPGFLLLDGVRKPSYGWLRLKYDLADATGIVAVSRIAPEPFAIRVLTQRGLSSRGRYRVEAIAVEPESGRPVPNVALAATLEFKGNNAPLVLKASGRTNTSGNGPLEFDVSSVTSDSYGDLDVRASLGAFVREIEGSFSFRNPLRILVSSDKPLYQAGQKLRVRAVVFDSLQRAAAGMPVDFTISDSGDTKVFEARRTTSRFGEADTEWTIPENAVSGDYRIQVSPASDRNGTVHYVRVGRYDLPNFTVTATSDRPYYLTDQDAEVRVQADYLFGRPVPSAQVRVVRESERRWNYREKKWDVQEGDVVQGFTDERGAFLAKVALEEEHRQSTERNNEEYRDLAYAAYVTDPSTGRTEQRRFSIRIAQRPIHLYLIGSRQARGFPLEFYLSASYADGSPAVCDISIFEADPNGRDRGFNPAGRRVLRTVRTNRYGVTKVEGLMPPAGWVRDGARDAALQFVADDGTGKTGERLESFWVQDSVVRVETNKTLYRASDPVAVTIRSSRASGPVLLTVVVGRQVLYSRTLALADGKADAVIPNSTAFRGDVVISAYQLRGSGPYSTVEGRVVSFPGDRELQLEATADKSTYAPADEAVLTFRVRDANGTRQGSLLGITVLDKAVVERFRTDEEFGGGYTFCPGCMEFLGGHLRLGGLTHRELSRIDRSRPMASDLELAAEALLAAKGLDADLPWLADDGDGRYRALMFDYTRRTQLERTLASLFPEDGLAAGEDALRALLVRADPNLATDPWGNPYGATFAVVGGRSTIVLISSGPDERIESPDDFTPAVLSWPYFQQRGAIIQRVIQQYHLRTGGYVRDSETLKRELAAAGHDFDSWRDPIGRPYGVSFGIRRTEFTVTVHASDHDAWTGGVGYTNALRSKVDAALVGYYAKTRLFPETESTLGEALAAGGVSGVELTDPWGRPYYSVFQTRASFVDNVTIGVETDEVITVTPATVTTLVVFLRSAGPDGVQGTSDDFDVVSFSKRQTEQTAAQAVPQIADSPVLQGATGAIRGSVVDPNGLPIPGATVMVTSAAGSTITGVSDAEGIYQFRNLPAGTYDLQLSLQGFQTKTIAVPVRPGALTRVAAALEIGGLREVVAVEVQATTVASRIDDSVRLAPRSASTSSTLLSTPRLREYFPETLVWQPALETGTDGSASLRVKLADNVTTWKVSAIATTTDGRIGLTETEVLATQPFFIEHDPPKVLTQGDEIALPVVVRSYLAHDQSLHLGMKREDWFALLDAPSRGLDVKAGEASREVFRFRALEPVKEGKQRVTGAGTHASDAIERVVTVRPNGQEITQTSNRILRGSAAFEVEIPLEALTGGMSSELKIYPNLTAHVVDAIDGIMRRPYGCAEQVISSAYPSVMLLRYYRQIGQKPDALAERAGRFVQLAYDSLLPYRMNDGGFSYWGRGTGDPAVTAYAIQFLHDARDFVKVDEGIAKSAVQWLAKRQSLDYGWSFGEQGGNETGRLALTAFVVRVLAESGLGKEMPSLRHALEYVRAGVRRLEEPYAMASLALAALKTGDKETADWALDRLRAVARDEEGGTAYWNLETNTPFYSWGLPGRLETTALVVRALAAGRGNNEPLIDRGLLFLLRNKDRFGVWYSTQTTVNVLGALVSLTGSRAQGGGSVEVLVDGARVMVVALPRSTEPANPIRLDLSKALTPGVHRVELRTHKGQPDATLQLTTGYYVPWDRSSPVEPAAPLRLAVSFDKTDAAAGETITCHVEAERVGFRGYGMMLAEIGLPPGADVDRKSLEDAIQRVGWSLYRYEVLTDRVVAYLWPAAGGSQFDFTFRVRYGIRAQTPASTLYDYYNPEANALVRPAVFVVR